jgi:hypothetical protein
VCALFSFEVRSLPIGSHISQLCRKHFQRAASGCLLPAAFKTIASKSENGLDQKNGTPCLEKVWQIQKLLVLGSKELSNLI